MPVKVLLPLASTALVLAYPFVVRQLVPLWPAMPPILLMLPPTLINAWLGWIFGRTLAAGREPLISTFARLERARLDEQPGIALPPELQGYTRRLTVLWTVLLFGMAGVATWLAVSGRHDWWALFTGVFSYLLISALFFGEYLFRRVRFHNHRHGSPIQMIWHIAKAGPIWLRQP